MFSILCAVCVGYRLAYGSRSRNYSLQEFVQLSVVSKGGKCLTSYRGTFEGTTGSNKQIIRNCVNAKVFLFTINARRN